MSSPGKDQINSYIEDNEYELIVELWSDGKLDEFIISALAGNSDLIIKAVEIACKDGKLETKLAQMLWDEAERRFEGGPEHDD